MRTLYRHHRYPFKVWDWSELPQSWGWRLSPTLSDDDLLARVRHELGEIMGAHLDSSSSRRPLPLKRRIELTQTRAFARQFAKCANEKGTAPLWTGLIAIDNDLAFLKYLDVLLPHMWT
jgi:hypothetical protein